MPLPKDFPRPPQLSGGGKVRPFLLWLAEQEDKRSATCRARELRSIADWLLEVAFWAVKQSERTGA